MEDTKVIAMNLFEQVKKGIIVSCQALPNGPLYGAEIMARMAYAAEAGGAVNRTTSATDVVLLTAGKELPLEGGSIGAKISQLFLIDLICEGLARKDLARAKEMKEKMARAVIDKIY